MPVSVLLSLSVAHPCPNLGLNPGARIPRPAFTSRLPVVRPGQILTLSVVPCNGTAHLLADQPDLDLATLRKLPGSKAHALPFLASSTINRHNPANPGRRDDWTCPVWVLPTPSHDKLEPREVEALRRPNCVRSFPSIRPGSISTLY